MWRALLALVLLTVPAAAQQQPPQTVEQVLKEQLGELVFNNAILRAQAAQAERLQAALSQCQAQASEQDKKLEKAPK